MPDETENDSDEKLVVSASEEDSLALRGYRLIELLGEGSYAKVYKSEYTNSKHEDVKLACKVVDVSKASKDFVNRFLPRELSIIVRVNHPHIVHVHSIFQRRTKYYMFMRYCERGDILEFVVKQGALPETQTRVWFKQLALALQYLHDMDIAHRDIKCENILITANFNLKIADFGFARQVTDSKGMLVFSETYCGSLSYVSPEILKGKPYNAKVSDVWSLGVVLYIMLNKAMPFDDKNVKKLYKLQTTASWSYRSKVVHLLSAELKGFLPHLLQPSVDKRWNIQQIVTSTWLNMAASSDMSLERVRVDTCSSAAVSVQKLDSAASSTHGTPASAASLTPQASESKTSNHEHSSDSDTSVRKQRKLTIEKLPEKHTRKLFK